MTATAAFPRSFLDHHFVRFMDAWTDRLIKRVGVDDLAWEPRDEEEAARSWALINDLDPEDGDRMLERWRTYRADTPPEVPSNVTLGEN